MSISEAHDVYDKPIYPKREGNQRRHRVLVSLSDEQMAAAEGWRVAHGIAEQSEALGELIRLGLLSEIAKIYKLVSDNRTPPPSGSRNGGGFKEPDHSA